MNKYSNLTILIKELSKLNAEDRIETVKNLKYTHYEKNKLKAI